MRSVLAIATLTLVGLVGASCNFGQTANRVTAQDDVRTFVHRRYIHGVSMVDARALGTQAVPRLHELLAQPSEADAWANIVAVLGFIGDRSSVDVLTRFLTERFDGEVNLPTFTALLAVPLALGDLARARGDSSALGFLRDGAHLSTWNQRAVRWRFRSYQGERLSRLLTRDCVNGIARIGGGPARDLLGQLQSHPESSDQAAYLKPNIADAVQFVERLEKDGEQKAFITEIETSTGEPSAGAAAMKQPKDQPLIFVAHVHALTNAGGIDGNLATANNLLQNVQTTCPDTACSVAIRRQGIVDPFGTDGDTLDVVTNSTDLAAVFAVTGEVKIVVTLGFCKGLAGSYLGCTKGGTKNMIISDKTPADVYAHEFGHAQGLPDNDSCATNIMHSSNPNTDAVSATECAAFLK
jgi:hypothetical protein